MSLCRPGIGCEELRSSLCLHRLKAEIESLRLKNDESLSSVQLSHDAEIRHLRDQLTESDGSRQRQIEDLEYKHTKLLEGLHQEMINCTTARDKLEDERNELELELAKALQDLDKVKVVDIG